MPAVGCTAVESNFCSWMPNIMLSSGVGGMSDAGRLTDAIDPSSTASWFSINFFAVCKYWLSLHLCHLCRLLLTSAPCPQLAYPCYSNKKC